MLEFIEKSHQYLLDGKPLISVTQLMKKHGLSPNYDNVNPVVLEKKANYGTLIHEEIENYIKYKKIGFTAELIEFDKYYRSNQINALESEFMVNNDIVAGTIDLILEKDGQKTIADIKTTYQVHKEAVSWQLSIYLYLLLGDNEGYETYNGQCYHFNKGKLKVLDIPLKPRSEVIKLIELERNGIEYECEKIEKQLLEDIVDVESTIKFYENKKKEYEEKANILKEKIIQAMEENGIISYESDNIKITYICPSVKTTLDTKLLKQEQPDIYEKYKKESNVKQSIRITIKENKDE